MHPEIKHSWNFIFIAAISVLFISCSSFSYFKKPAGNKEKKSLDQIKITRLESELAEIKQEKKRLNLELKIKDDSIEKFQGTIRKMEHKIQILEKKNKTIKKSVQYKIKYKNPIALYKKARNLLVEENYSYSAALFRRFIKKYPENSLADNAVYWLGECHYSMGKFKKAILVFKDLETRYPKSEKVPDAILKTGYSYLSMDDSNRAHHYLTKVLKKYPFSPAAEKAQEKLKSFE